MRAFAHVRFAALGLVALAALLALPGGALAAGPIQTREDFVNDFTFADCGPLVTIHEEGTSHDTLWAGPELDANGLPLIHKERFQIHSTGTYTANGETLTFSVNFT